MIVDIAFNITDSLYSDKEHGGIGPIDDRDLVMRRALSNGVVPIFVGDNYARSLRALFYAKKYKTLSYAGIHPNWATRNIADFHFVKGLTSHREVIALGECGLDYFRDMSTKEDQIKVFTEQLDFGYEIYFFHLRNAFDDFCKIVSNYRLKGVIHSFTGNSSEAKILVEMGFYISVNGCSFRENMDFIRCIPLDRILVETDAPFCRLRPSYFGYKHLETAIPSNKKWDSVNVVKSRNEPICVREIVCALSNFLQIDEEEMQGILLNNTKAFFGRKMTEVIMFHDKNLTVLDQ